MRSASANILIGFLCVALLASVVPLRDLDGRPEMWGGEFVELDDAVRFVQKIMPVSGGSFLGNARNAVLALEALAGSETRLCPETGVLVFSDPPAFIISQLPEVHSFPQIFPSSDVCPDNHITCTYVLDPPPPRKNSV
jgi:hypothetical protein